MILVRKSGTNLKKVLLHFAESSTEAVRGEDNFIEKFKAVVIAEPRGYIYQSFVVILV